VQSLCKMFCGVDGYTQESFAVVVGHIASQITPVLPIGGIRVKSL
jgi:hypothetical protein